MNRTIKFRAFDKFNDCFWFSESNGLAAFFEIVDELTEGGNDLVIEQFTGLLDKDGKEIYEGDITNYGTVKWYNILSWDSGGSKHSGFWFEDFNQEKYGLEIDLDYHTGFFKDIEVIGTIHDPK